MYKVDDEWVLLYKSGDLCVYMVRPWAHFHDGYLPYMPVGIKMKNKKHHTVGG